MNFRGSYVALVTPFNQKGLLDRKALENLVEWHIAEGTDGIVCSATTGEGISLSDAERKRVAAICIGTAAGRVPVIVATGVSDTKASIRYTEMAQQLGASGCLVVTPYYNKPSQRGCLLHFQEVAKVGLPVIVYHNPARAVVRLTAETILQLSQVPHIVAIKESSADLELVRKIAGSIAVFAGEDDLTVPIMREGGVGSIAVTANLIPRAWKQMVVYCLEGKWDQASALAGRYASLCKAMFIETNPQGVKWALSRMGRCHPVFRLPMVLPTAPIQEKIRQEMLRLALPQAYAVFLES